MPLQPENHDCELIDAVRSRYDMLYQQYRQKKQTLAFSTARLFVYPT